MLRNKNENEKSGRFLDSVPVLIGKTLTNLRD